MGAEGQRGHEAQGTEAAGRSLLAMAQGLSQSCELLHVKFLEEAAASSPWPPAASPVPQRGSSHQPARHLVWAPSLGQDAYLIWWWRNTATCWAGVEARRWCRRAAGQQEGP